MGFPDKEVTFLRKVTGTLLPAEDLIHEQLVLCFARQFGYDSPLRKDDVLMSANENLY